MSRIVTGLIGQGIKLSLSPCIHKAFFEAAGMDGDYKLFDIANGPGLKDIVAEIKSGRIHGLNVTSPYKVEIMSYCNELSSTARRCMAVNTIRVHEGKLMGDLTDVQGFARAIKFHGVRGKTALVLGSGGVVRAVIAGLEDLGFESIHIHARNQAATRTLQVLFPRLRPDMPNEPVDLIINATPLTGPETDDFLPGRVDDIMGRKGVFFDLNYHGVTRGMRITSDAGRQAFNGLSMLVFQAAVSWGLWFENTPDTDAEKIMRRCANVTD